jgi:hypothetical protein
MKLLYGSHDITPLADRRMQVFEKSALAREAGAALHLAPNANGLLRRLGIYADEYGANPLLGV